MSDSLSTGTSSNLYQFSGTAGELVYFQGRPSPPAIRPLLDPLRTRKPGPGQQILLEQLLGDPAECRQYDLVVDGINPSNTSGVSFNFTVYGNVDSTSPLSLNTPVTGTFTNPGDLATYTFTGSAGQTLFFNGQSSVQGTIAELIEPSGNELFEQYIGYNYYIYDNYGPFTLSEPGTYELIISNDDGDSGAYKFSLDDTSSATTIAVAPGPGTPVTGAIASGLSVSMYSFSGTSGEQVFAQAADGVDRLLRPLLDHLRA